MLNEQVDKVIGLFSIDFSWNEIRYSGKGVNYNLNGVVIIRNREVGYEIYRDGLPGCIM